MKSKLEMLNESGQAIWLDFIQRSFLNDGSFDKLLKQGIRGVTSNPSIFEKAIANTEEYDEDIRQVAASTKDTMEIYESVAIADIQLAADKLRPLYDAAQGADGFVSLEVSPTLAHDTEGTIADAKRLHTAVNRPNLMIKIPATPEGIPAIEATLAAGINVNVTLIFSLRQYEDTVEAYIKALEKRLAAGEDISKIASVASFFVSRVDTAVDKQLEALGHTDLQGHAAVDNAKLAYERFKSLCSDSRWQRLADAGAVVQRPLWASTGTKNPAYPDTLYVDTLVGPHTVNTVPPATLDAVLDHGKTEISVENDCTGAQTRMAQLKEVGVDMDAITEKLLAEGVDAFANAFKGLLDSVEEKRKAV